MKTKNKAQMNKEQKVIKLLDNLVRAMEYTFKGPWDRQYLGWNKVNKAYAEAVKFLNKNDDPELVKISKYFHCKVCK